MHAFHSSQENMKLNHFEILELTQHSSTLLSKQL